MGITTRISTPAVPQQVLDLMAARTRKVAGMNAGELHSAIVRFQEALDAQRADGASYPELAPLRRQLGQKRGDLRECCIARQMLFVELVKPGKDAVATEQPECAFWSLQQVRDKSDSDLLAACNELALPKESAS